jgi:dihydroflavonol-4-reductase
VILGPGDWNSSSARLFQTIWRGLMFYTEGVNGYVDVRDVVKAMIALMESDIHGERFIVTSENRTYRSLFSEIAEALGKSKPRIPVTRLMGKLGWRLEWIRSYITGSSSLITRETATTASGKYYYSNVKIKQALDIDFIPVSKSIADTAAIFLEDIKKPAIS